MFIINTIKTFITKVKDFFTNRDILEELKKTNDEHIQLVYDSEQMHAFIEKQKEEIKDLKMKLEVMKLTVKDLEEDKEKLEKRLSEYIDTDSLTLITEKERRIEELIFDLAQAKLTINNLRRTWAYRVWKWADDLNHAIWKAIMYR